MFKVSWMYNLSKDNLTLQAREWGLSEEGTVDRLRQRLVRYVRDNPETVKDKPEDPDDFDEDKDKTQDRHTINKSLTLEQQQRTNTTMTDQTKAIDQMRKWGLHFDGRDAYSFLEHLEELQTAYGFSDNQVFQGFAELLRNDAQLWYRNTIETVDNLRELKKSLRDYYIQPGELRHLDRLILECRQAGNEPIRAFVIDLCTLMRRHGGYNTEKQLDMLYYNAKAEYRLYLKRKEITSINELVQLCQELDEIQRQVAGRSHSQTTAPPSGGIMTITAYDRQTCCWRCKQRGHNRFNCKNEAKKFCSHCGRDGILSRDCKCTKQGNGDRAGPSNNRTRPRDQPKTDTLSQSK